MLWPLLMLWAYDAMGSPANLQQTRLSWCRMMCQLSVDVCVQHLPGNRYRKQYKLMQQLSPWNFFLSSNIHRDTKDFVLTDIHLKQKAEWHVANGSCMSTAVQRHCGHFAKIFLFCIPCFLTCTKSLGICRHHGIMAACDTLPTTFPTIVLSLWRCTNRLIKGG